MISIYQIYINFSIKSNHFYKYLKKKKKFKNIFWIYVCLRLNRFELDNFFILSINIDKVCFSFSKNISIFAIFLAAFFLTRKTGSLHKSKARGSIVCDTCSNGKICVNSNNCFAINSFARHFFSFY